jgi:hypothetical protein
MNERICSGRVRLSFEKIKQNANAKENPHTEKENLAGKFA